MDKVRVFVEEDIRQRLRQLEVVHQRVQGQSLDGRVPVIFQDGPNGAPLKVLQPFDLLELVGKKRGMMLSGGVVNTERAAITVLDEFRSGKIGRISLERPHTAAQTAVQEEV